MTRYFCLIFCFSSVFIFSQEISAEDFLQARKIKIDSLKKIDFLSLKYKNLDQNFAISIDNDSFQRIREKFGYRTAKKYSDSLNVILMANFNDWDMARIAALRIDYRWERIGYYLWIKSSEAELLANKLGFNHPYRFYEYLINEEINTATKISVLKELMAKLKSHVSDEMELRPYKNFLKQTFKLNPERIKATNKFLKKHSRHKH